MENTETTKTVQSVSGIARRMAEISGRDGAENPITAKQAQQAILLFKEAVLESVREGNKVVLTGLFSVNFRYVPERVYKNPLKPNSPDVTISEHILIGIKASKVFKQISEALKDNSVLFEECKRRYYKTKGTVDTEEVQDY